MIRLRPALQGYAMIDVDGWLIMELPHFGQMLHCGQLPSTGQGRHIPENQRIFLWETNLLIIGRL